MSSSASARKAFIQFTPMEGSLPAVMEFLAPDGSTLHPRMYSYDAWRFWQKLLSCGPFAGLTDQDLAEVQAALGNMPNNLTTEDLVEMDWYFRVMLGGRVPRLLTQDEWSPEDRGILPDHRAHIPQLPARPREHVDT